MISLKYSDSLNKLPFVGSAEIDPESASYPQICKMGPFKSILALEECEENGDMVKDHLYYVKKIDKKQ